MKDKMGRKKPPQEENHIPDDLGDFQEDTVQDQSAKKPSVQKKKGCYLLPRGSMTNSGDTGLAA